MSSEPGSEENPYLPQTQERLQKAHESAETLKRETASFLRQIETGRLAPDDDDGASLEES